MRIAVALLVLGFGTKAGTDARCTAGYPTRTAKPRPGLRADVRSAALGRGLRAASLPGHRRSRAGPGFVRTLLLAVALASLALAASLLIAQRDYKRLLAYSSIEHMGLVVIGLAIGTPLAIAAVCCTSSATDWARPSCSAAPGRSWSPNAPPTSPASADCSPDDLRSPAPSRLGFAALLGLPPFSLFVSELGLARAAAAAGLGWVIAVALALLLVVFVAVTVQLTADDPRHRGSADGERHGPTTTARSAPGSPPHPWWSACSSWRRSALSRGRSTSCCALRQPDREAPHDWSHRAAASAPPPRCRCARPADDAGTTRRSPPGRGHRRDPASTGRSAARGRIPAGAGRRARGPGPPSASSTCSPRASPTAGSSSCCCTDRDAPAVPSLAATLLPGRSVRTRDARPVRHRPPRPSAAAAAGPAPPLAPGLVPDARRRRATPAVRSPEEPYPFLTVDGPGVYEIPVGPDPRRLIEPGHFRFSVVGETILKLKARLWFVHKGSRSSPRAALPARRAAAGRARLAATPPSGTPSRSASPSRTP